MGKLSKSQFSARAFGLHHDKPNDFAMTSWQESESPIPLLLVRVFLAAATMATWLWSLVDDGATGFWFIYLTNWGLMLLTLSTSLSVIVSLTAVFSRFSEVGPTPWFVRCYWLIYNISTPVAFLITIFYWIILYDSEAEVGWYRFSIDLATHGGNSAVMMIELLVSRTPSRFLHFYQPFGFGVWYAVFSAVYYEAGGTDEEGNPYVYDVVDWSTPGPTMVVVAATAAGLLSLHVLVVCVALLRSSISSSLVRSKGHDLPRVIEANPV